MTMVGVFGETGGEPWLIGVALHKKRLHSSNSYNPPPPTPNLEVPLLTLLTILCLPDVTCSWLLSFMAEGPIHLPI